MQTDPNKNILLKVLPGLSRVSLRQVVQVFVVLVMVYAAWQYYGFVEYVKGSFGAVYPERPPVVEGFLPIAAIVAFKAFTGLGIFDTIHPAGLVIFIAILLTGWIFRRALCSWICPIGTLSEYLGSLGSRLMGRELKVPKWLDVVLLVVKYGLFLYVAKMLLLMPAEEAAAFMQIPYYAISDIKMFEFFMNIGVKGLTFILVLIILSVFIKSFWCRYLCPYGALLGILGLFSPFFIVKDQSSCTNCSLCNKACPGRVDVEGKKKYVISTECTGCTSCVSVCPREGTLQFKVLGMLPVSSRVFSIGFIGVFFGIILWAKLSGHWESSLTVSDFKMIYQAFSSGFGPQ